MTRLTKVISCITRRHRSAGESDHHGFTEDASGPESGQSSSGPSEMKACLTLFDLVSLGVGSCLGTGMYLTAGLVASTMAGPSGVLSLLMAGVASMLTGLCYAELAGLCPRTSGSAYMYAYITVGELAAFVIGWGLVVEYVIGTAAGAVALSETLDSLSGGLFTSYLQPVAKTIGLPRLDLLAALICALLTLLLASGAEMSAKVNNGLNITNIVVLVFFIFASLALGSSRNWVSGGFFPFGLTGVVRAIPTCYFAYIGFDTVAATGAEAQDPSRSIPRSLLLSILINCLAYVIVILFLTFDLPFYMLHHDTAMTDVFPRLNFVAGKYIVAIGAVSGEFASTFGSMFPLPRVLTAMAADGLIFRQLGKICPKRHTPVRATLLSGFVAMVMATFFNITLLIELVLIGTLLAYILVTFAVLYMRYIPENLGEESESPVSETTFTERTELTISRNQHEERSVKLSDLTSHCDDSSVHRKNRRPHRKQLNLSRSYSTNSSCKRVTFSNSVEAPTVGSTDSGQTDTHRQHSASVTHSVSVNDTRQGQTRKSAESAFKPLEFHPLLEDSSSAEEDELLTRDGLIFQRQASSRKNKHGKLSIHTPPNDQNPGLKNRKSEFRNLLVNTHQNIGENNDLPLWLKIVTHTVDAVSESSRRVVCLLCAIYCVEIVLCVVVSKLWKSMADGNVVSLGLLGFLSAIFMVLVGIISFMPQSLRGDAFRAPLVPVLPVFVALVNIYLMTSLSLLTWLMFGLWMSLGLLVYLLYGINHSQAGTASTYIPLSQSAELSMVLDDDDDDDDDDVNDEANDDAERSLLSD